MQTAGTPQVSPTRPISPKPVRSTSPAIAPGVRSANYRDERAILDQMLANARLGVGGSLVLRGDSGSGKTSLLTYAVKHAAEFRVTQAAGVQPEMDLGFAALHGLLTPFLPRLDHLPGPQRHALGTAFGLVTAAAPDRFLVGLAVMSLLTEAAEDRPVLLAIDDAHWLDEATADVLAFVARRLTSMPVAFAIAVREPTTRMQSLDGLPPLHLATTPRRHESASPGPAPVRPAPLDAMQARLMAGNSPAGCRNAHQSGPHVRSHRLARAGLAASAVPDARASLASTHAEDSTMNPSTSVLALGSWAVGELLDSSSRRAAAFDRERSASNQGGSTDLAVSSTTMALDPPGDNGAGELPQGRRGQIIDASTTSAEHVDNRAAADTGANPALAHYALTVLDLGNGRYLEALARASEVFHQDPPELGTRILPDLIEAAVRSGDMDAAASALERLSERTRSSRAPLESGLLARSKALLTDDADALYQEAIEHLRQSDADVDLARTHLLYGEWLRRRRRRRDAREQLRAAQELFDSVGFPAFAHRASVELRATSEAVRKRRGEPGELLTSQEAEIARLVAEGSSNRQVAAQLFISQNTVEYHLQKVFRKIGVSSRTQLARAIHDQSRGDEARVSRFADLR
jgi:DNA-binding CsgD family transcriptional regulator